MRRRRSGRRQFLSAGLATAAGAALTACATDVEREAGVLDPRTIPEGAAGETPPSRRFLRAVAAGNLQAVRSLLASDPGLVHLRDGAGRSAFALALLHHHPGVADLLRERGHRPDLHESALALDWQRFAELAEGAPALVNRDHPVGGTAMVAAALGGAGTGIWRVYAAGGEPDAAPCTGEPGAGGDPGAAGGFTAVRAAFEHPDLATAELTAASLLGNGADPVAPQPGGRSALHAAAARGSVELVEMLIRKGAPVDAKDAGGRTPLDLATEARHAAAAARLRRHREIPRDHQTSRRRYDMEGRPYRSPDLSGLPVLERSAVVGQAHSDLDAVRRAVGRHPGLAHAVATTTEAAVEAGAHMGRQDVVGFLLEQGAPYSLPTAAMRGDLAGARRLLDEDPLRIHERGPHDFALLWYPVIGGGLVEMAALLLDRGARVERQHWLGTTALHFAAQRGQIDMARLLLERGADPGRRGRKFDPAGQTPVEIAETRGHGELVRLLRSG